MELQVKFGTLVIKTPIVGKLTDENLENEIRSQYIFVLDRIKGLCTDFWQGEYEQFSIVGIKTNDKEFDLAFESEWQDLETYQGLADKIKALI